METKDKISKYSRMPADNNPSRFIDPDGSCPDDIIHVGINGCITHIEKTVGPCKIVNDKREELTFNNPTGKADTNQFEKLLPDDKYNFDYANSEIKLFINFSDKDIGDLMIKEEVLETLKNMHKWSRPGTGPLERWIYGHILSTGKINFLHTLANVSEGGNGGRFFLFEDGNTLYNLQDAGNFLTGFALNAVGLDLKELKPAARMNELKTGPDTSQMAIEAGFRYFNEWLKKMGKMSQIIAEKQSKTTTKKRAIRSIVLVFAALFIQFVLLKLNFDRVTKSYITWLITWPLCFASLYQSILVIIFFFRNKNAVSKIF